jgi:GT2 family glycosyltransferase
MALGLRPDDGQQDPELCTDAQGQLYWHAISCDPVFLTEPPPVPIAPGWYHVRVQMVTKSGLLAGPRLYLPDNAGHYSEARAIELTLDGDQHVGRFYLPREATRLRFDPSIYPCDFTCSALQITPLTGAVSWQASLARLVQFQLPSTRLFRQWCRTGWQLLTRRGPRALLRGMYETWLIQTTAARTGQPPYADWFKAFAQPDAAQLQAMAQAAEGLKYQPVISLITPVYNPPEPFLRAAIESVMAQVYPHWELCLADDASTAPHVRQVLAEYAARDARIKLSYRDTNGHISVASNTALQCATGQFVALFDHDDTLTPDALFWVARELDLHPDAALIYSDEDKLDYDGVPANPYFKCDWNYDLFLSHNLITHLGVYRADVVKALGGFRKGFEGAQDYDLALRFIEQISHSQIRHIPRVLYHWRMLPGSTAIGAGEKDYAAERARLAVQQHLERQHIAATVSTLPGRAVQRVQYQLNRPEPRVSIIIPTRNACQLVQQCVESIYQKSTYTNFEILLVDNGSDEPESLDYFDSLAAKGKVRLLKDPGVFNFSRINNDAAKSATGEYLVFLNNDIEVITPDWLSELVSHAQRPGVGAVGAKLWYPNNTVQHAGLILVAGLAGHAHLGKPRGDDGYFGRATLTQEYSAVTGACLCMARALFESVGGFDETLAVAFNDVDLCLRLHDKGHRNLYTPFAELYHHESASRGYEDTPEKMGRFKKEATLLRQRWLPLLMNDPFYNPNLSLTAEPFTLAWPPRVPGLDGVAPTTAP